MDGSTLLGVLGIVVSIVVGFLTFYIADRRSRRNKYQTIKTLIHQALFRALGEENPLTAEIIRATIRSVIREHGNSDLTIITLDEIVDDLIRQITADPFIDADRRKRLQDTMLAIRASAEKPRDVEIEEYRAAMREAGSGMWGMIYNVSLGLIASLAAAAVTMFIKPGAIMALFSGLSFEWLTVLISVIGVSLTMAVFVFERHRRK